MNRLQFWLLVQQVAFFVKRRNYARAIVACLFFLILLLLAFFSFSLGRLFMEYMGSFGEFSKSFLYLTLLSLVSSLSVLSLLSFTIAFLKTFFDKQLVFFFLFPSRSYKLALWAFLITLVIGSWPYLLISLPFFFGMIQIGGASFAGYFTVFILHLMISLVIGSIGGILAIILFLAFGRRLTSFLPIMLIVSLLGLFLLFTKFIFPVNLEQVSSQPEIWQIEQSLNTLPLALPYLPTTLFVESFSGNNLSVVLFLGEACFALIAFILTAKIFYKKAWQINFEGYLLANSKPLLPAASRLRFSIDLFPKTACFAFIKKEMLSFKRTVNAVIYLSFIIFLASLFLFFLSRTGRLHSEYERFASVVNLAIFFVVTYLTLLFTIRFVFPTFAIERSYIWSVITSAAFRRRLSLFKWVFYQAVVLIFTIILGVTAGVYYKIPAVKTHELLLLFGCSALLTSTFALMVGQIFQKDLPKDDVEDISTTIPGILVTIFSLASGVIIAFLFFFLKLYLLSWILLGAAAGFLLLGCQFSYCHYKQSDI